MDVFAGCEDLEDTGDPGARRRWWAVRPPRESFTCGGRPGPPGTHVELPLPGTPVGETLLGGAGLKEGLKCE